MLALFILAYAVHIVFISTTCHYRFVQPVNPPDAYIQIVSASTAPEYVISCLILYIFFTDHTIERSFGFGLNQVHGLLVF